MGKRSLLGEEVGVVNLLPFLVIVDEETRFYREKTGFRILK
jgi:hypothetical protein